MKKAAERTLEGGKELTFSDRVAQAVERAERNIGSGELPKVLEGAVQLVGFGDDLITESDVETAWGARQRERLAA